MYNTMPENNENENHDETHSTTSTSTNTSTQPPTNTSTPTTDASFNVPVIVNFTTNETITQAGFEVVNQMGTTADGDHVVHTTFTSTDPETYAPNINENLVEVIDFYDDITSQASVNNNTALFNEISTYASKIQCSDFHGKGTIDDYAELFRAASKIANETKQIELDVDIEGFNEISQAADELSALFQTFTVKLQNVNIINDTVFLTAVVNALKKIYELSEIFGEFKKTILTTTTIQVPKSIHDTSVILHGVMSEIDCAMNYITHFVTPGTEVLPDAELSAEEKNIITSAVTTIDNWNILCEQGVSIAMADNPDIQYINSVNANMKQTNLALKSLTATLKTKLNGYINL
jgi:isopentenyl diphosphate isomerase/L-lactate dehydrogenase-like FMN-dependent dehydrogenase